MRSLLLLVGLLLATPAVGQSARWLDDRSSTLMAEGGMSFGNGVNQAHKVRTVLQSRGRIAWAYSRLFPQARSAVGSALGVEGGVALDGGPVPDGLGGHVAGARLYLGLPVRVWLFNDPLVGAVVVHAGLSAASGGAWWNDLVRLQPYGALSLVGRTSPRWQWRAHLQLQPVSFTPWPQDNLTVSRDELALELGGATSGLELLLRLISARGEARIQPRGGPSTHYSTRRLRDWAAAAGVGWRF